MFLEMTPVNCHGDTLIDCGTTPRPPTPFFFKDSYNYTLMKNIP